MTDTLSTSEVAALLGISRQAVHKRIKAGTLPAVRIGPSYRITLRDALKAVRAGGPGRERKTRPMGAVCSACGEFVFNSEADEHFETITTPAARGEHGHYAPAQSYTCCRKMMADLPA